MIKAKQSRNWFDILKSIRAIVQAEPGITITETAKKLKIPRSTADAGLKMRGLTLEAAAKLSDEEIAQRAGSFDGSTPLGFNVPLSTHEIFEFLKDRPRSLSELARKFDRAPETMLSKLNEMEAAGYMLVRTPGAVSIPVAKPHIATPAKTIADEVGMDVALGFISDTHAGDKHSQPSAIRKCAEIMGNDYGVRHFFSPGDLTTGVYVYRGQDNDLIPSCRPARRELARQSALNQVWLANEYIPKNEGSKWFILGGNHDWTHVIASGTDPVRIFCDQRDDATYMGYDSAGIWITDKFFLRLWHPTGGIPYAKSYKLQKGTETLAIEALKEAIKHEETPAASMLMAGHLHIAVWLPELPIPAGHVGCFEGQTSLGKRLGKEPALGGVVIRLRISDSGRVQRIEHTFLPFDEIEEDWKNFPVPEIPEPSYTPEQMSTLFSFQESSHENPSDSGPH